MIDSTKHFNFNDQLSDLLDEISKACLEISKAVQRAPLEGHHGLADSQNVQGEDQKPLDLISNDIFIKGLKDMPGVCALVSEELEDVIWTKQSPEPGDLVVYFDPLDGSSNIDVNLSVGTIFSVAPWKDSILCPGSDQVMAGYAIYGPALQLVLTDGESASAYTYDSDKGQFVLTTQRLAIPTTTKEFAINMSRQRHWHAPVRSYIDDCLAGPDGPLAKSFNMRWAASMVADVHRILTRGGVFLYPTDNDNADKGGKLRLLYEANPMAMIVEAAGGKASTGHDRILHVEPTSHHQRVGVILGSADEVDEIVGRFG